MNRKLIAVDTVETPVKFRPSAPFGTPKRQLGRVRSFSGMTPTKAIQRARANSLITTPTRVMLVPMENAASPVAQSENTPPIGASTPSRPLLPPMPGTPKQALSATKTNTPIRTMDPLRFNWIKPELQMQNLEAPRLVQIVRDYFNGNLLTGRVGSNKLKEEESTQIQTLLIEVIVRETERLINDIPVILDIFNEKIRENSAEAIAIFNGIRSAISIALVSIEPCLLPGLIRTLCTTERGKALFHSTLEPRKGSEVVRNIRLAIIGGKIDDIAIILEAASQAKLGKEPLRSEEVVVKLKNVFFEKRDELLADKTEAEKITAILQGTEANAFCWSLRVVFAVLLSWDGIGIGVIRDIFKIARDRNYDIFNEMSSSTEADYLRTVLIAATKEIDKRFLKYISNEHCPVPTMRNLVSVLGPAETRTSFAQLAPINA